MDSALSPEEDTDEGPLRRCPRCKKWKVEDEFISTVSSNLTSKCESCRDLLNSYARDVRDGYACMSAKGVPDAYYRRTCTGPYAVQSPQQHHPHPVAVPYTGPYNPAPVVPPPSGCAVDLTDRDLLTSFFGQSSHDPLSQASYIQPLPTAAMASPLPNITVLGSLNIDLVSYVPHHPLPGETMTATSFTTSPGGKGANQAVACAKLSRGPDLARPSASVCMIGAVGADAYGSELRDSLASYGVDVSGVAVREGGKTGIAIIVVDEPTGQNRIMLSPESNHSLLPSHFTSLPAPRPDLLIMQLEIPFETVMQALRAAKAAGVPILLNPAPAQELPAEAYEDLAHLIVNETEAALLSGCREEDLDGLVGLQRVGGLFLEMGVRNLIITLGGRGVFYASKAGKSALLPAEKTTVVDTTAAGDTFVGSYALAVVAPPSGTFDIADALRIANRAAAMTVAKRGAQVSIPWKTEL